MKIKSSYSGPQGNCYQVERSKVDVILLSDSKQDDLGSDQPKIQFTMAGWMDVTDKITNENALSIGTQTMLVGVAVIFEEAIVERTGPDQFVWRSRDDSNEARLKFTLAEHDAFLMGVNDDEFLLSEDQGPIGVNDKTTAYKQPDLSERTVD